MDLDWVKVGRGSARGPGCFPNRAGVSPGIARGVRPLGTVGNNRTDSRRSLRRRYSRISPFSRGGCSRGTFRWPRAFTVTIRLTHYVSDFEVVYMARPANFRSLTGKAHFAH